MQSLSSITNPATSRQALEEIARRRILESARPRDFAEFAQKTYGKPLHDWQRENLCPLLDRLTHERGLRILIHAPPQYGKSMFVSMRFPAYVLGIKPETRIVVSAYNISKATEFTETVRRIMLSPQYREMFPDPRCWIPATCGSEKFSTPARKSCWEGQDSITAVGLQTGFTGKGADLLIIDDPYASPEEAKSNAINEKTYRFWTQVADQRIEEGGNVVVMFHRYHEDDLAGRLEATGEFEVYRFPAIAGHRRKDETGEMIWVEDEQPDQAGRRPGELLSPRRSKSWLEKKEEDDPFFFLAFYQGVPRAPEGNLIRLEDLQTVTYGELPRLKLYVRYWDLATSAEKTNDYTAGALCGVGPDQTFYLRNVSRFRAEWPEARRQICRQTEEDLNLCERIGAQYAVGVEKVAWMRPMIKDLFEEPAFSKVRLWPMDPRLKGDKKERANAWIARARNNLFRMVGDPTWNPDFIKEALAFTGEDGVGHDDQVDAVSGAYDLIWEIKGGIVEERKEPEPYSAAYWRKYGKDKDRDSWDG